MWKQALKAKKDQRRKPKYVEYVEYVACLADFTAITFSHIWQPHILLTTNNITVWVLQGESMHLLFFLLIVKVLNITERFIKTSDKHG